MLGDNVTPSGAIKSREALHLHFEVTAHPFHNTNDAVPPRCYGSLDWHEIYNLRDAVLSEEARDQDIGIWPIELLASRPLRRWRNFEKSATLGIEQRCKNGWRIEMREAQKVNVAVDSNERGSLRK